MLIDRDFKITYMNEASRALIKKHREHFPARVRELGVEALIGSSADIFHKDPSHQRTTGLRPVAAASQGRRENGTVDIRALRKRRLSMKTASTMATSSSGAT